jgi:creatinine amidohydrolase
VRPFSSLRSPEVDPARVLVVPIGSVEQHGPHLPLNTDTVIAEALAAALCDDVDGFVLGPTVGIGASGEHAGFPGTLSIGTEVLSNILVELVYSARGSCAAVYVVNGHGGNAAAIHRAAATLEASGDRFGVGRVVDDGDAHAGHAETSLILHLAPHLVGSERPVGRTEPLATLLPELQRHGMAAVSPSGVLGDATTASAADGLRRFEAMRGRLATAAQTWREEWR